MEDIFKITVKAKNGVEIKYTLELVSWTENQI
jgi:hypothetical protein